MTKKKTQKKRPNWACGPCDFYCQTKDELIAHCQREHRDNGYLCWDQAGTLGSQFADSAMETFRQKCIALQKRVDEAEVKAAAYDKLLVRWNALCRAIHIGNLAMQEYQQNFERDDSRDR